MCVKEIIEKYRIVKKDIYNIDKTSFKIDVTLTSKVVYRFKIKQSHVKAL